MAQSRTMVLVMTALRPTISLPLHGALELCAGLLALVAPFALGFSPAGIVVSVLFGACAVGLALDAANTPAVVSAHHVYDYALAFGAVYVAVMFALSHDTAAALTLGALGVSHLGLNGATRYSAPAS
jgi:hypothetical protein